jgi:hypothetical protein
MLETSLSLVAAFAVFIFYAIAGDEIRKNRTKPSGKKNVKETLPKEQKTNTRTTKPKASPVKTKVIKSQKVAAPESATSDAILAYLTANGPVTITKLTKALQTDEATVKSATEKLIKQKSAVSIKRGGYPAIALNES